MIKKTDLNPKFSKKMQTAKTKIAEWNARGIDIKKIERAAWNNWGVSASHRDGMTVFGVCHPAYYDFDIIAI